jgi:hypothetical protein
MVKVYIARKRLRVMCSAAWERVQDKESGDYFYRKIATGEVRWDQPSFYVPPEGVINTNSAPSTQQLLETAKERLQYLRENRPTVESTDWPLVLPSGNRYEGQCGNFGSDKPHGAGVLSYLMGGRYMGEFVRGRRHGWGVMIYPNGSSYEGEWVDDRITGMGVKCETNGTRYEGEWVADEFVGIGIYMDARGMIYQGEFSEGNRHGYGVEFLFEEATNGRHNVLAGKWERNNFLSGDPRLCCDTPDPITQPGRERDGAVLKAHEMARRARVLVRVVAENRSKANQARRRGNDERKRTMLTMDTKRLQGMARAMKGGRKFFVFIFVALLFFF